MTVLAPFNRKTTLTFGTTVSTRLVFPATAQFLGATTHTPPLFETVVYDVNGVPQEGRSYATEEEAEAGHSQAVRAWQLITEGEAWFPK
jgi:hypothetical protein